MPKKPRAIVLDSWAVIAYLEDEDAAAKVADLIADAHDEQIPLLMTVVNAGEVWYIVARQMSAADADGSIKQLRDLGIQFVDADWGLAKDAGYFKSKIRCHLQMLLRPRSRSKGRRIWQQVIKNLSRSKTKLRLIGLTNGRNLPHETGQGS